MTSRRIGRSVRVNRRRTGWRARVCDLFRSGARSMLPEDVLLEARRGPPSLSSRRNADSAAASSDLSRYPRLDREMVDRQADAAVDNTRASDRSPTYECADLLQGRCVVGRRRVQRWQRPQSRLGGESSVRGARSGSSREATVLGDSAASRRPRSERGFGLSSTVTTADWHRSFTSARAAATTRISGIRHARSRSSFSNRPMRQEPRLGSSISHRAQSQGRTECPALALLCEQRTAAMRT